MLWPGIHRTMMAEYKKYPKQCDQIFGVFKSDKAYEEDVATASFGLAPVKTEGGTVSYDSHHQQGVKRYAHTARALGYKITREERDDNLYMSKSTSRSAMLRDSMIITEETVCASVFNNGFTVNGWDGVPLFSALHPSYDVGAQSNILTTAADLSEAAVEDLLIQIADARDNRGKLRALKPSKLIVSTQDMFEAQRIVGSPNQPGTANNDINAMRALGFFSSGPMLWNYLTDSDAWFIKTDLPDEFGLKKFNRTPFEFGEDKDFDTMNHCYAAYMRFSVSYSDWRAVYGSAGTA